jgi:N-acetylglucosaminyldiphosphoundecaprenol N-acetyl-beta-D-mannosaminyltransferase
VNILGVGVSAINMSVALDIIDGWIKRRETHYVTITGVHGVMESQKDSELRRIHNVAGLVTPDGMPLVWISRLLGFRHVDRVYGPDLMLAICKRSPGRGYRHFFYGGGDGVAALLKERLQARYPGLDVVGTFTPPFRPLTEEEDEDIVQCINALSPDIVWIGLSTPKQERWMAAHLGRIGASVMIGVGAAFDFHAGLKKEAPYWIQRSGLQWLFRLVSEPRRLWKRYLTNNPAFAWRITGQLAGLKHYEPDW